MLRSKRAIQVNLAIMRTFVRLREVLATNEIIDTLRTRNNVQTSKRSRLITLRAFLSDPRTDDRIQVIPHRSEFSENLTIFGDWWVAESLRGRIRGNRETTFTWHPGTVKRFSDKFDEEFEYLCEENGVKPEQLRLLSVEEIDRALALCG